MEQLCVTLHRTIHGFPKFERHAVGERMIHNCLDIMELALLARTVSGKSQLLILRKIDVRLGMVRFLCRHAAHLKCMSVGQQAVLAAALVELGKLLGGWIRNVKQKGADGSTSSP